MRSDPLVLVGPCSTCGPGVIERLQAFAEVSDVLRQRPGLLLASAALVVVDVNAGTLTYATAGHPPPVVQLPGGKVRRLDDANAPMIGLAWTRRVAGTVPFPVGSVDLVHRRAR
jgi:hypothetical protein